MRTWLAAVLLLSAALAGCAGEGTGTTDSAGGTGTTSDGNETVSPSGPGGNTAPTANLTIDVANGTAPLNVTFSIDGSDADGDKLTWNLSLDGTILANGAVLPATFNQTFEAAGNYTIELSISDGAETAQANLTVVVWEGGAAALPEDQHFEGTLTGLWVPLAGYVQGGIDHTAEIPSPPATMSVHLTWARTDAAVDIDVYIYDPDGNEVAAGNNYNDPVQGDDKEEELVVINDPAVLSRLGTWTFTVISAGSAESPYSLDVTFT